MHRVHYKGDWHAHPGVWERQHDAIGRRTRLDVIANEEPGFFDADRLADFDLLYLAVREPSKLDQRTLDALKGYLQAGGMLLMDAADGQPDGIAALRDLVDALDVGEKGLLAANHPIVTGSVEGGHSLIDLETTKAGVSLYRADAPPPIITRNIGERIAVLACPFDLVAALESQFIWRRIGYVPEATAKIVDNILLWRRAECRNQPGRKS